MCGFKCSGLIVSMRECACAYLSPMYRIYSQLRGAMMRVMMWQQCLLQAEIVIEIRDALAVLAILIDERDREQIL